MNLKNRPIQELIDILKSQEYIPYNFFIKKYKISERTLRNDLNLIDKWLSRKGLPILLRNKYEGIYLDVTDLIKYEIFNEFKDFSVDKYIKSKKDRRIALLIEFLFDEQLTISIISKKLGVSRNTVIEDLNFIEYYLKGFNCKLVRKQKVGLYIDGSEYNIRNMYLNLLVNYCNLFKWDIFSREIINEKYNLFYKNILCKLFNEVDTDILLETLESLEKRLYLKYADESKNIIMAAIALTKIRCERNKSINFNKIIFYETIKLSKEYRNLEEILKEEFKQYPSYKREIAYISIYLLTKKVIDGDIEAIKGEGYIEKLNDIVEEMINIMEDYCKIKIKQRSRLLKGLLLHLEPAIYRLKYDIKIENPIIDEIKKKYSMAYNASKLACSYLEQMINLKISEEEICYVAIHFGSAMETQKKDNTIKVVLVCNAGISTVRILEKSLKEKFENFKVIDILSYFEYKKKKELITDLIITTIPLKEKENYFIKVNPFLTQEDIENLSKFLNKKEDIKADEIDIKLEDIINIIQKYCFVHNKSKLIEEVKCILKGIKKPSLKDILTKDNVIFKEAVSSWEEAVDIASKPLLEKGYIQERYIKAMKENIKRLKAYVVIKKGVSIPHAKPEDGVKNLSFSLLILKKGVNFNHKKNDPVKIVLITASNDKLIHLKALEEFMNLVRNDNYIKKLSRINSYEEFKKLLP
ncbi:BglG family transcription antiterminator [Tepidibacter formicigenes]|jgi:transcriptional antiterminator/mannitol/fructose-specific phosphotransferase system IIA component (Ntr-type)|uniref:Transcriptional antiterminator n=1 Tax=Tepidibacter formicigenes DSM 15518 TaxID=1123349 RepID=A0A1M6PFG4_9FIRM|nr:BglG family transcription antiterminator [Tepidibacter formicigenes]SHK06661.1 Transcriptional antiterminator [Tepidibacter formicigenes DSM 15518]